MRDKFLFSDAQAFTNLSAAGVISQHIWDLEEDVVADQAIQGCLMVQITAASLVTGLTEGIILSLRVDDAVGLATAQNGSNAGYKEIASKHILKEEIVAGKVFAIPVYDVISARAKYMGFWPKAKTTALTGSVTLEAYFVESVDDSIKRVQKKPV